MINRPVSGPMFKDKVYIEYFPSDESHKPEIVFTIKNYHGKVYLDDQLYQLIAKRCGGQIIDTKHEFSQRK